MNRTELKVKIKKRAIRHFKVVFRYIGNAFYGIIGILTTMFIGLGINFILDGNLVTGFEGYIVSFIAFISCFILFKLIEKTNIIMGIGLLVYAVLFVIEVFGKTDFVITAFIPTVAMLLDTVVYAYRVVKGKEDG